MFKRMKKIDIFKMFFALIALFLIFGIILYLYGTLQKTEEPTNVSTVENTISNCGYFINDNASNYYKSEFNNLKTLLEGSEAPDDNEYMSLIAKLFVIDLMSFNDKINKYEVTSSQYFLDTKQDMFTNKVVDNFYNIIEDNSYDDRKQALPEVSEIVISNMEDSTYIIEDIEYKANIITIDITYEKDLGYDKEVIVTLIKKDNKYYVVKYNSPEESWK